MVACLQALTRSSSLLIDKDSGLYIVCVIFLKRRNALLFGRCFMVIAVKVTATFYTITILGSDCYLIYCRNFPVVSSWLLINSGKTLLLSVLQFVILQVFHAFRIHRAAVTVALGIVRIFGSHKSLLYSHRS